MHDHRVVTVGAAGTVETIATVAGDELSGLGWLPDGRLLVVSMERQWVLRQERGGTPVCHPDLSSAALGSGQVLALGADGSPAVAWDGMAAPNGLVLTPDERTLVVAESAGLCLTAGDRAEDGRLHHRLPFAHLLPADHSARVSAPDSICLEAEGVIWVADPVGRRVLRVRGGGATTAIRAGPCRGPASCRSARVARRRPPPAPPRR